MIQINKHSWLFEQLWWIIGNLIKYIMIIKWEEIQLKISFQEIIGNLEKWWSKTSFNWYYVEKSLGNHLAFILWNSLNIQEIKITRKLFLEFCELIDKNHLIITPTIFMMSWRIIFIFQFVWDYHVIEETKWLVWSCIQKQLWSGNLS